jgi:predicted nuclease of restriction endonuclease-like RecB superfamily
MDTPKQPDPFIIRLTNDVVYLRREILEVMAGQLALTKVVIALAEKTAGQNPHELKERLVTLTNEEHQKLLSRMEDISPALAAFLDTRSPDDVADGTGR